MEVALTHKVTNDDMVCEDVSLDLFHSEPIVCAALIHYSSMPLWGGYSYL